MGAAGEEVDGLGVREGVALLREAADIAREGGRITGDIDDALRGHADHGLDDIGGKALARRIDDDDIRRLPGGAEALGGLPGIRAEEFRVPDAVAAGVFLRVADGGLDKLDADGALRLPRKAERDGARAAIEVEDRLCPGQAGCCQRFAVEPLCLRAVDLIERAGRDAEAQAAVPDFLGVKLLVIADYLSFDFLCFFGWV